MSSYLFNTRAIVQLSYAYLYDATFKWYHQQYLNSQAVQVCCLGAHRQQKFSGIEHNVMGKILVQC